MAKNTNNKQTEGKETVEFFKDLDKEALKTEKFLEKNTEFQLIPVEQAVGHNKFGEKYLKLWPHKTNTDGFFAAILKKKG